MAWKGTPSMVKTPEASSSWSSDASTLEAVAATGRPSAAVAEPSRPTMKAWSAPSRLARLPKAERIVAASLEATASRKPKSRESRAAPSCSCPERRAQMRLNTVAEEVSSSPTWRTAAPEITA